ncbi:MAG: hypothetical protein KIS92_02790 [Planctomycetota bacterium]|nr:hypothetical protein [Planctomycetota bacterium]
MSHATLALMLLLWTGFVALAVYRYLPALRDAFQKWKARSQNSREDLWQILFCLAPSVALCAYILLMHRKADTPAVEIILWVWGMVVLLFCQAVGAFQGLTDTGEKADAMDLVTVFIYGLVGAAAGAAMLLPAAFLAKMAALVLGGS